MAADSIKELQEYACRIVRRGVKTHPPLPFGKQPLHKPTHTHKHTQTFKTKFSRV